MDFASFCKEINASRGWRTVVCRVAAVADARLRRCLEDVPVITVRLRLCDYGRGAADEVRSVSDV